MVKYNIYEKEWYKLKKEYRAFLKYLDANNLISTQTGPRIKDIHKQLKQMYNAPMRKHIIYFDDENYFMFILKFS